MLGERIAALRRREGLSQKALAERIGVSASAVGMYEQNRREPDMEKLILLSRLFGVSVDFLLLGRPDGGAEDAARWRRAVRSEFSGAALQDAAGRRRPLGDDDVDALLSALPDRDETMMQHALALAREAADEGEVPVGCVIARGSVIVGRGRNRRERSRSALAHAELEAIAEACRTLGGWRLWECTLYVTLEPCPMCAGAIINARIPRVVYGARDPKAGSCGSVCDLFCMSYNHQPRAERGLMEADCADLLRTFFRGLRRQRKEREK